MSLVTMGCNKTQRCGNNTKGGGQTEKLWYNISIDYKV